MDDQYIEPEEPLDEQPDETGEEPVDIYSKLAIRAFSIFFGTIFGGVLLMINLRNVGYKKAAWQILAFSIVFSLIPGIIISTMGASNLRSIGLLFNVVGGIILADYFFPKYFPENDYYPRPIWTPLIISVLISLAYVMLMYYSGALAALEPKLAK